MRLLGMPLLCVVFGVAAFEAPSAAEGLDAGFAELRRTGNDVTQYDNCGLNVTYATMRLFGLTTNAEDVAASLRLGKSRERQCSLADIKRVIEDRGLVAVGLHSDSPKDVLEREAETGAVVIARTRASLSGLPGPHFISLLPTATRTCVVMDPPVRPFTLSFSNLDGPDPILATGEYLVVRRGPTMPSLVILQRSLDLGQHGDSKQEIIGRIAYRNAGDKPVAITGVEPSCGCTTNTSGTIDIAPGEGGVFEVAFRRQVMPVGVSKRLVRVKSTDPRALDTVVSFQIALAGMPLKGEILVAPALFHYGRISPSRLVEKPIKVRVLIPGDAKERSVTIQSESSHNDCAFRVLKDTEVEDDPGGARVIEGEFVWRSAPDDGSFERVVHLRATRQGSEAEVHDVVIRGDCVAQ